MKPSRQRLFVEIFSATELSSLVDGNNVVYAGKVDGLVGNFLWDNEFVHSLNVWFAATAQRDQPFAAQQRNHIRKSVGNANHFFGAVCELMAAYFMENTLGLRLRHLPCERGKRTPDFEVYASDAVFSAEVKTVVGGWSVKQRSNERDIIPIIGDIIHRSVSQLDKDAANLVILVSWRRYPMSIENLEESLYGEVVPAGRCDPDEGLVDMHWTRRENGKYQPTINTRISCVALLHWLGPPDPRCTFIHNGYARIPIAPETLDPHPQLVPDGSGYMVWRNQS